VRAAVTQERTIADRRRIGDAAPSASFHMLEIPEGPVACLAAPQLFFAEHPRDIEKAKALCRDCPAREVCLAAALKRREPWGVWGGELLLNGRIIADKRARGRPPKVRAAA
jgi:WhiB family transcriptional regulator, redox-sensing transcriptional regulator